MRGKTFAEKILGAPAGSIVFRKPDLVLSHDNTASIEKIFRKMKGLRLCDPDRLVVTLDHNAPPTNAKLANDYKQIRLFAEASGISRFHDVGEGICHQLMTDHACPGMIITGSDSHTCTAGALNAFATGIDRTETAGIWKTGETWFRVPESLKITLTGNLPEKVYAKDVALHIIGSLSAEGADYLSVEFHGDGLLNLSLDDRMTIANMVSEMGAKNGVFPADEVLHSFTGTDSTGIWADPDAVYMRAITIPLDQLYPVVACPHQVDNVKAVDEVAGIPIGQALIGTCTNGRISDLRVAARVLKGRKAARGVQLMVIPASREIYLQALREGIIETFLEAGANILSPSCGPCLGTGQGIPADDINVISTANRNFPGRMGNSKAAIYLASPATVALSAIEGKIVSPASFGNHKFHTGRKPVQRISIPPPEIRKSNGVWDYSDADNLNTDQMFSGNLTYEINSTEPEKIVPHLFKGFDIHFAEMVQKGDVLIAGENFGCGSSREHPAVGLAHAGVKAIIVKSVSRIFFRSAINQGLPVIVLPEAVNAYHPGDNAEVRLKDGIAFLGNQKFPFPPLPDKLMVILENGGLVNTLMMNNK
jgi:3-isopropylmalate/(R)-2-methylmalate dehydratase large subunit